MALLRHASDSSLLCTRLIAVYLSPPRRPVTNDQPNLAYPSIQDYCLSHLFLEAGSLYSITSRYITGLALHLDNSCGSFFTLVGHMVILFCLLDAVIIIWLLYYSCRTLNSHSHNDCARPCLVSPPQRRIDPAKLCLRVPIVVSHFTLSVFYIHTYN